MTLSLLVGKITLSIFCVYTLQCNRPCEEKDDFFSVLLSSISTISPDNVLIVCEDLNNHIGKDPYSFEGIHIGYGYGIRNAEGTRILDVCHHKPCSYKLHLREGHQ